MTSIRSPQQLGRALRAARKQLGLTQPQLALAAGVGVRFIVDLEVTRQEARLGELPPDQKDKLQLVEKELSELRQAIIDSARKVNATLGSGYNPRTTTDGIANGVN